MRRRKFILALGAALLNGGMVVPVSAQTTKIARVGILSGASLSTPANAHFREAFVESLRKLGWEEGRNLIVEARATEGIAERFAEHAAELVALQVDVAVGANSQAVQALKDKTRTIPIVMLNASSPVEQGFIVSLARPGGNITGVTADVGTELVTKHLELLKELTPTASRVGLLAPKAVLESAYFRALRDAAQKLGVAIIPLPLESPINEAQYRQVFAAITADQVHGLIVGDAPENFASRSLIFDLVADHRLPAIYTAADYARSGGLMSYGTV